MIEDPALTLKKACEKEPVSTKNAQKMLAQSELIGNLLTDPKQKPRTFVGIRAYEWRLLELSEIPFTHTLKKVQNWLELLVDKTSIPEGFSLTGKKKGVLACHNALITLILTRMEYDKETIDAGIDWILDYQSVERGKECTWTGTDLFERFGGCMKKTPCYYGVVKSMVALTEYKKRFGGSQNLATKLSQGLEYILKHHVFKRLSTSTPIEPSIIENFYPYPYKSNIIEILSLLNAHNLLEDQRCKEAIEILRRKRRPDGFWQADVSYMKTAWVEFDTLKTPGPWISSVISRLVESKER